MIEIEIDEPDGYLNKYNKNELSNELSDYILNEYNEKDVINIKLNYKYEKTEIDKIKILLKNSFNRLKYNTRLEYEKKIKLNFIVFIIGILLLIMDHMFNLNYLISEIILVSCWVIIWENMYYLIFETIKVKKQLKKIKKLLLSKINLN